MAKYKLFDLFEGNYPITQRFGANSSYYQQFGFRGHEGVDWGIPVGKKLLCPFQNGLILRSRWEGNYGNTVVVWDPFQRVAVWDCHLSRLDVHAGQVVTRGHTLGLSGRTGNVTGPHLHANFCETDAYKNRLNTRNGYKGFLNILDPNLVSWTLSR